VRLALITNYPSHHQVDVFNALAKQPELDLKVFYLRKGTPLRQHFAVRAIEHEHEFIRETNPGGHFYLSPGLAAAVDLHKPDVLLITQYASIGMQWMMYRSFLQGRKWIYWSEAPGVEYADLPVLESPLLRRAARRVALWPLRLARPSQVWGIGRRASAMYARMTRAQCENVPYFSDLSALHGIARGDVNRPIRFLYAGRLVSRKGFDILLEAVAQLATRRRDFEVRVIGEGPQLALLDQMPDIARQMIRYAGFRPLQELPNKFAECDVLVYPSRYDGWGMAVVEAMAAGMAVIASSATGAAIDLIDSGHNGLLIDSPTAMNLAAAMEQLLDNPAAMRQMGEQARQASLKLRASVGAKRIAELAWQAAGDGKAAMALEAMGEQHGA
jgi:glycosyltransferase involved in cell wall biosynthesis